MKPKINYPPTNCMISRQLNLLDFGLEKKFKNFAQKIFKDNKNHINVNKLVKFIEYTYNYAKMVFNKYSSYFSKHLYTQPVLFTILAIKIYTKATYRQTTELLNISDKIQEYLKIKRVPHYTTIQKFFKKLPSSTLQEMNKIILSQHTIKGELIALDGTGFTNDYADKYYAKIRRKERKSYVKNHIAIDVETRLILHYTTNKGPKYDTTFAISTIRQIKKYKPRYIIADKAYDTEPIRKCINEEAKAFDQIPLKKRAKKGHYRLNSSTIFRQKIYAKRNNVESVFSVIKRIFDGTNRSRSQKASNKETKLKNTIYNIYRSIQIK